MDGGGLSVVPFNSHDLKIFVYVKTPNRQLLSSTGWWTIWSYPWGIQPRKLTCPIKRNNFKRKGIVFQSHHCCRVSSLFVSGVFGSLFSGYSHFGMTGWQRVPREKNITVEKQRPWFMIIIRSPCKGPGSQLGSLGLKTTPFIGVITPELPQLYGHFKGIYNW